VLFNAMYKAGFQPYHGEKILMKKWCLLCTTQTSLVGFLECKLSETNLQQSEGIHVDRLGHIILIPSHA